MPITLKNKNIDSKLNKIGNSLICPVAIMINNERILMGYRNYTKDKWKDISVWTVPGGRCDIGETIKETLIREIYEEVGINDFEILDFIDEVDGVKENDIVPIFLCKTEQDFVLMEPEKFSEWKWVNIDEYIKDDKYWGFNTSARRVTVEYLKNITLHY